MKSKVVIRFVKGEVETGTEAEVVAGFVSFDFQGSNCSPARMRAL